MVQDKSFVFSLFGERGVDIFRGEILEVNKMRGDFPFIWGDINIASKNGSTNKKILFSRLFIS